MPVSNCERPLKKKGFAGEEYTIADAKAVAYEAMGEIMEVKAYKGISRDGKVPDGARIFRRPFFDPQGRMTICQWYTQENEKIDYRIGPRQTRIETYEWKLPPELPSGPLKLEARLFYSLVPTSVGACWTREAGTIGRSATYHPSLLARIRVAELERSAAVLGYRSLRILADALKRENMETGDTTLLSGEVPDDAAVLAIVGPTRAYTEVEIEAHPGRFWESEVVRVDTLAQPDREVLVITGDVTDQGRIAQFRSAKDFLASVKTPFISVPGNREISASAPLIA